MSDAAATRDPSLPRDRTGAPRWSVLALAAVGSLLAIGAAALWARHGASVFIEMATAALAYCL